MKPIFPHFEELKKARKKHGLCSENVSESILNIFNNSQDYLKTCDIGALNSKVSNKSYFSFNSDKKSSRAINKKIYDAGISKTDLMFQAIYAGDFSTISSDDITNACYVISISYCSAVDLLKSGDQKTPGTFFEYFIGHLYAKKLGVEPRKSIEVLNLDRDASLPTDFIFDLGVNKAKIHLPVKTSTRERVIQVWAHQRLLDGVYGAGRFLGTLVCLAETKTDKKKLEVVEICLPTQWRLYQMYIAQLKRIYYLDIPDAYANLASEFPKIPVKKWGDFFSELKEFLD